LYSVKARIGQDAPVYLHIVWQ